MSLMQLSLKSKGVLPCPPGRAGSGPFTHWALGCSKCRQKNTNDMNMAALGLPRGLTVP